MTHDTHSKTVGYILWIFGFTEPHRFYFGKPISATLYFFTFGFLLVGYIYDYWTLNDQITVINGST